MGKGKRATATATKPLEKPTTTTISSLTKPNIYNSQQPSPTAQHQLEEAPLFILITTYISYLILILFGHLRDVTGKLFKRHLYRHLDVFDGYAPINSGFDTFYQRRIYMRVRDVFNRPVTGVPGRTITLLDRVSDDENKSFRLTGGTTTVMNLSSYNYLGFAQNEGPCADAVERDVMKFGISVGSSRLEAGTSELHNQAEALVAEFVGKPACLLVSMGFATNSTTLPSLVSTGSLIISDELNHASLVFGARISGAHIRTFKHNDVKDLERVLRECISIGHPRTRRAWKKILVVVEGLYSMEGTIVDLPGVLALKKKYKFYLYLDEAHSIGAMGPNGKGVCDYYGVDPREVDILMGTFTKSFGAAGGYLAGSTEIIQHLRTTNHANVYAEPISIPILTQITTALSLIASTDDGKRRIQQLSHNAKFFAKELRGMGFIVYGVDSPVVPLLLFNPAKIRQFSREMLKRGIAVVVVGYPATPIITSRVRFCLSSAHSEEDLRWVLRQISEVGDLLGLKVSRH